MKRTPLLIGGTLIVAIIAYAVKSGGGEAIPEIEYRYAKVQKGELLRSISATGLAVAMTTVDVKSKAGGNVIRLLVAEGARVKKGDLIAVIDPADTQALYEQASADLRSADARASQADSNVDLQISQSATTLADARAALDAAKVRLRRAAIEERRQPALTDSAVRTAQANLDSATAAQERLEKVAIPQNRRDAQSALEQAEVGRNVAQSALKRQEALVEKGYVATSTVETARNALAVAEAAYANAKQRSETVEAAQSADLRAARLEVARAEAALGQARANSSQDDVARTTLAEARETVRQAEIAVTRALADRQQIEIRRRDVDAARAATVRSRVATQNAKEQLDSTRVYAPRDGVVTMKYLEEGTIIPPGTSTFAEGTSLVQLADVTQLFIECAVDEADVGNVKAGQSVRIVSEAYPNETLEGVVTRVNPAATTENNITAIKVRVKVFNPEKSKLLPGMNATCEFITLNRKDVLIAPSQAVKTEDGKSTVRVKTADVLKPQEREVKIGATGNEGVEILSGLEPGDEVVTAEIDVAELKATQEKMKAAEEGGGLAGGPAGGKRKR